jgi:hypothetical protein
MIGYRTIAGEDEPIFSKWRFSHVFLIGRSLMGKSTFLKRQALDDVYRGDGLVYFDFTGRDTKELMRHIPISRKEHVVHLTLDDTERPVGFNPLWNVSPDRRDQVVNELYQSFKDIHYPEGNSTPNVELYMTTTLYALLDVPDSTLLGIYYMLASETYRNRVVSQVKDSVVESFWTGFYTSIPDKEVRQQTQSTLNKMFSLIVDKRVQNVLGQVENKLDLKKIVEEGQILLVTLPEAHGREKMRLLATLILSQLHAALRTRESSKPFHIYLDNVHRFGARTVVELLDGVDGLNVSITMAHRYLAQLEDEVRDAILGTVGTMICYRLGVSDAKELQDEYPPDNSVQTLTELSPYTAHVKLPSHQYAKHGVFYEIKMPKHRRPRHEKGLEDILATSRESYGTPRESVETRTAQFVDRITVSDLLARQARAERRKAARQKAPKPKADA